MCTKFEGESGSGAFGVFHTQYNNNVPIIILFEEWPLVLTSDLRKLLL